MSLIDPPYLGFFPAQVVDNDDPQGLYRIKFVVPSLMGDVIMEWARPIGTLFGGGIRKPDGTIDPCGFGGAPPIGAAIMVCFVGGDLSFPYYTGGWYAEDPEDANNSEVPVSPKQTSAKGSPKVKIFETEKWRFFFDDDDVTPILRLERKGSEDTSIEIDGATEGITIKSKTGGQECSIILDGSSGTITIDGDTKIDLGAAALNALVKGTAFKLLYDTHVHPDPVSGSTGPPTVLMDVPPGTHLSAKVNTE
jgi:hypothetical protein